MNRITLSLLGSVLLLCGAAAFSYAALFRGSLLCMAAALACLIGGGLCVKYWLSHTYEK